jgi:hypothetical protein
MLTNSLRETLFSVFQRGTFEPPIVVALQKIVVERVTSDCH